MPTSSRPRTPSSDARTMSAARLTRSRISRASTRKAAPAEVSSTILLFRRSNWAPELLFQCLDGCAQRRLRDGQPISRAMEVQLLREHAEIAQVVQLHGQVLTELNDPQIGSFILQ
jgi:hypothetical protein